MASETATATPTTVRGAPPPPDVARAGALTRRRQIAAAAAAIVGAYLATRLLLINRFPYFFDEGVYATFTNQAAHSLHQLFISLTIAREPLQIWLGIPLVKLGFNPLTAVRLVSLVAGLSTVVVVGLLAHRLGGKAAGWVAAGLCVVLPFFVVHDGIGIAEPLVTLVMASALLVQIHFARRPRLAWGALLGVVLAAGVLTKRNTEPAILLVPLSLLCFDWSGADVRRRLGVWLGGVAIAALFVVGAELLLRSSGYWHQYQQFDAALDITGKSWSGARPLRLVLRDPFFWTGEAWSAYWPGFVAYVTVPLLVATGAGAVIAARKRTRLALVLLAWILVPLAIALTFSSLPFPRHVMYLMPPAIALMAYAFVRAGDWVRRRLTARKAATVCAVAATLLLLPAAIFDVRVLAHPATAPYPGLDRWQYVTGPNAGAVWSEIASAIRRRATGRQVVILTPAGSSTVLPFLLEGPRYVFAAGSSPLATRAQFAVTDSVAFNFDGAAMQLMAKKHFVPTARFRRHPAVCRQRREVACNSYVTLFQPRPR